ncbi:hypothetical protein PANT_2c00066 [Moesziomyces antarcticus T-34]|uniref:Uncharacterized protein n=1 Tax=Pseudozyma antarctica (strain T-34) TaxID=1151754 RepID=M9MA65_PSEA3|nr:hypothetical protein PANT_2c00066 [Moesziomyces antarcticus T-34]
MRSLFTPSTATAMRASLLRAPRSTTTGNRLLSSTRARLDDQSRAKGESLKQVVNRPEITPLFLFTGGIVCLALFFGSRHLLKDKELRLDHAQQNRLKTQTEQLDFDAMKHVAEDPEGKLTKQAIDEERERGKRLEQIKQEKEDKANKKL